MAEAVGAVKSGPLGANGVPVTIPGNDQPNADGLRPGEHYLVGGKNSAPAAVALAAYAWYRQHRLAFHADGIHRALSTTTPTSP